MVCCHDVLAGLVLPGDQNKARDIRLMAARYILDDGELVDFTGDLMAYFFIA